MLKEEDLSVGGEEEAVEVADVPAGEALPIQAQDPLHLERRRRAPRGPLAPTIIEGHRAAGRARQRRTLRGSRPRISAACTQLIAPLSACMMTCCTFMARSTAAAA